MTQDKPTLTKTVKQSYIHFSSEWEHVESQHVGPFLTSIAHRRPDGSIDVRTSRRHRKNYGAEVTGEEKNRPKLLIWRPRELNWWIALLFMIGALHFIIGSLLILTGSTDAYLIDWIFFAGSIFFTGAGYSRYYQAINAPKMLDSKGQASGAQERRYVGWQPERIDFWATFPLFLGTLAFNVTTFTSFFTLQPLGYDLLVWVPKFVGSVLFLLANTVGVFEFCHRFWCRQRKSLTWWIVILGFAGSIAFMIAAFLAFVRPDPFFSNLMTWSTVFTLLGTVCFFVSAYLLWPEMATEEQRNNEV